jgi:hypothetical protein
MEIKGYLLKHPLLQQKVKLAALLLAFFLTACAPTVTVVVDIETYDDQDQLTGRTQYTTVILATGEPMWGMTFREPTLRPVSVIETW